MLPFEVLESPVANAAVALFPVLAFLAVFVLMDGFKLVPPRAVAQAIVVGGVAALVAGWLNGWLLGATGIAVPVFSRYAAPVSEELLKGLYVLYLLRLRRVGFLVDAAIQGFAVGTGFALVENMEYLRALGGASLILWLVRGMGAAVLHGATTSILAMLGKSVSDRYPERGALAAAPGAAVAVAIHSAFNHALVSPLLAALVLLLVLPIVVVLVFERSEKVTREWLGAGFDLDLELLKLILSGDFTSTRLGAYLQSLKASFPGEVVADMLCLLRIELELSMRAKGMLMAREVGLEAPAGPDLPARLAEVEYLERSIGRMGMLALKPLHVTSGRDVWHRYLLQQARGEGKR
jgi:RsiW-degrading membrane proteinase PrsW (M82 family)